MPTESSRPALRSRLVGGTFVVAVLLALVVLLARTAGDRTPEHDVAPVPATPTWIPPSTEQASVDHQGFLYGRVTTDRGAVYEGRLRWGGGEEAFWGDYFNGSKLENPWVAHVPPERLVEQRPLEIFGVEIGRREHRIEIDRPFMARFGDIARIEADGRNLRVRLKSGTVFHLDRFAADDLADGLRVWDPRHGVIDLDEWQIDTIELLPTPALGTTPDRLHGTVRTRQGEFTGFIQWDREKCVGTDEFDGHAADGQRSVRFDGIRSIARRSQDSALVTLLDGREIELSDTRDAGRGSRGIYVDDRRYGRVLVSWDAFERIDFSAGGSGPTYADFPPGSPLAGTVGTRDGRRLTGRLVYDLDESETSETLDASREGVDFTIPFGMIASIDLAERVRVTLRGGEELQLERTGDLGDKNAGMLIFVDGGERPEYVSWAEIERVEFDALRGQT